MGAAIMPIVHQTVADKFIADDQLREKDVQKNTTLTTTRDREINIRDMPKSKPIEFSSESLAPRAMSKPQTNIKAHRTEQTIPDIIFYLLGDEF